MDVDASKRLAAEAALAFLPESGIIGLGTGSTARLFVEAVGRLVAGGRKLTGVPTSLETRRQAEAAGIPLLGDEGPWAIDVCVDGADEVSRELDLIKGAGGAHSREKIVNRAARLNVIVVDESKLSERLGEKWPVPVEVLPFGIGNVRAVLQRWGGVALRERQGRPFLTDSGNHILDLRTGVIADPAALERELALVPGVVMTGLFIKRADVVIVAGDAGVRQLRPR
jgi:ribose 5-phosphate isomerase A